MNLKKGGFLASFFYTFARMRRLWSYIVLTCFVMLMLPKGWLHDHDHDDVYKTKNHKEASFKSDCSACDLDLSSFSAPILIAARQTQWYDVVPVQRPVKIVQETDADGYTSRGPPVELV